MNDQIIIRGARENNLKNINIDLPKNKLIVMTGVSGSGKSSLAFDTIYAEGQRRYVESLSSYARQFLGVSEKPDVDSIEGLSPAISIDQKTTNNNPRSTVGTVTEIYDYLRLLFSRIGIPYCPNHNIPIKSQTIEEMTNKIMNLKEGTKIMILSPVVHGEKGTHQDLLDNLRRDGYSRVKINGEIKDLSEDIKLDKNIKDDIDVIVDRLIIKDGIRSRLFESIETGVKLSKGKIVIDVIGDKEIIMSENYACPYCDYSLPELEPRIFSFNAPYGACPKCKGLGSREKIDVDLIIPDKNKSLKEGAILPYKNMDPESIQIQKLEILCNHYNIDINKSINEYTKKELSILLDGDNKDIHYLFKTRGGITYDKYEPNIGVLRELEERYEETTSDFVHDWLNNYMMEEECSLCHGSRLKEDVLNIYINKKNINDLCELSIKNLYDFIDNLKLNSEEEKISSLLIKDIKDRLSFLINVGLDYLSLKRTAGSLSGGESQRIRLATQIGSRLSGILYVLDEPSIGLHQRDNERLINSLKQMRDLGNTLIVVEHDIDTMLASDYLVDIGPGAGINGGYVVSKGTPKEVMNDKNSLTGRYLSGIDKIDIPKTRRKGNNKFIELKGCSHNNLKNIDVKFPLGKFICVTGVSGSGKSSLINETLYKILRNNLYKAKDKPGKYKSISGIENIDKVIDISQDPIGRSPRSNPATYIGVFDDIRDVFAETKESKIRGYDKGRFSFNVKGGRCEACCGDGVKRIEMHFLPDVYVPCEVCHGTRYNSETLQIKFKNKTISDILDMTADEALIFFENIPKIKNKLQTMVDVGLGYIKLGQSATTLSGGEAARVKLAKELQKRPTGKSLFILDEPTTGLHIDDIKKLLNILNRIVDNGDTVIVIEHNLDVIKVSDYIIDIGPEGGENGGKIIFKGIPEEIIKDKNSYTGEFLKKIMIH